MEYWIIAGLAALAALTAVRIVLKHYFPTDTR